MIRCPELAEWASFEGGSLSEQDAVQYKNHLSDCAACSVVVATLRDHDALADKLQDAFREPPGSPAEHSATTAEPLSGRDDIDEYSLIREISRTHFSIVYEAVQKSTGQSVALKVLLASAGHNERSKLRFEREVELLARLRHPHIVPIFHSGLYAGQYYFVMPFLRGEAPDRYAEHASLNRAERVRLIRTICDAVHHAHQRGIMHRDLKPSNILVDENGQVHVLDFGLAKISNPAEESAALTLDAGQIIGTPAYMSPEQAAGRTDDIDTRSDIYSLGVIAYRILVQRMPYPTDTGIAQTLQHIQTTDPVPLSRVDARFERDLETIVMKCLEKEPQQRYASAAALEEDLGRYLAGQPVLARGPSTIYHLRKLVARHKIPFAFLALILGLLAGFAVTLRFQRDRAQAAERLSSDITEFFVENMLNAVDPDVGQGPDVKVRAMFDELAGRVDTEFNDDEPIKPELLDVIGTLYRKLGDYKIAGHHLRRALDLRRTMLGSQPNADVARSLHNLASVMFQDAYPVEAERLYREALNMRQACFKAPHTAIADTLDHLASTCMMQDKNQEAEALYFDALQMRRAAGDPAEARTINNLATFLRRVNRYDEAEMHYREAIGLLSANAGDRRLLATVHHNLATCQSLQGKHAAARHGFERALEMKRRIYGSTNPYLANTLHGLADSLLQEGQLEESQQLCVEALLIRIPRRIGHPDVATSLELLGRLSMSSSASTTGSGCAAARDAIRPLGAAASNDDKTERERLIGRLNEHCATIEGHPEID